MGHGERAERWTAKNPPEAIRDIIRVWGFLTLITALVRHGADASYAIAAGLEVSAEQIGVKDLTKL